MLGCKARDILTGFEGIVTGRCEYLTGCTQYCLTPQCGPDGKLPEGHWFDDSRVEIIGARVALVSPSVQSLKAVSNGPMTPPPERQGPKS